MAKFPAWLGGRKKENVLCIWPTERDRFVISEAMPNPKMSCSHFAKHEKSACPHSFLDFSNNIHTYASTKRLLLRRVAHISAEDFGLAVLHTNFPNIVPVAEKEKKLILLLSGGTNDERREKERRTPKTKVFPPTGGSSSSFPALFPNGEREKLKLFSSWK